MEYLVVEGEQALRPAVHTLAIACTTRRRPSLVVEQRQEFFVVREEDDFIPVTVDPV